MHPPEPGQQPPPEQGGQGFFDLQNDDWLLLANLFKVEVFLLRFVFLASCCEEVLFALITLFDEFANLFVFSFDCMFVFSFELFLANWLSEALSDAV